MGITAREELFNHLKYLIKPSEASNLIDEYKDEILNDINYYTTREKILEEVKRGLIEEIDSSPLSLVPSFRTIKVYTRNGIKHETREQIDKVEVIKLIENFKLKE